MKILLAHNSPYYPAHGGGDRSNRLLMEALASRGHHCRVVARANDYGPKAQEGLVRDLAARGVPVLSSGSGVVLIRLNAVEVHTVANHPNLRGYFSEQIGAFVPDVILSSTDDPAQVLLDAALRAERARVIYLVRATLPLPFGPDCAFPSQRKTSVLRQADLIVGVSNYVSDYVRRWSGIPALHVPISLIEPGPYPSCGRFDNEFVTMVNPAATKGISLFLALAQAMPRVRFAAVPTWGTLAGDFVALQAMPNITILDPVDDIADLLKRTRLTLIPSLWAEARSRMVIESLIHGVPVMASNVGGLAEAMMGVPYVLAVNPIVKYHPRLDENMVPVPVVPEQDIRPWQGTIERLLNDQPHWEDLSARGRNAALSYATQLTAEPFERLLEETLGAPRGRRVTEQKPALSDDKQKLLALRLKKKISCKTNSWLPTLNAKQESRLRLFCFPFAGGGAAFFRAWGIALGTDVAVIPILLPGREGRLSERPLDSFSELTGQIHEALAPYLDLPFAFFGHSMGAMLAFELTRRLRDNHQPLPLMLVVSGARAPQFRLGHIPPPEPTEPQLIEQLRQVHGPASPLLDKPELMRLLLPALRADTRAYRGYIYEPAPPLPVPICGYGGREDPQVSAEQLDAWRVQTSDTFSLRLFQGGHFYLRSSAVPFLKAMAGDLTQSRAAGHV